MPYALCSHCMKPYVVSNAAVKRIPSMACPKCGTLTLKLAVWTPGGYKAVARKRRNPGPLLQCELCKRWRSARSGYIAIAKYPIYGTVKGKKIFYPAGTRYCRDHHVELAPAAEIKSR